MEEGRSVRRLTCRETISSSCCSCYRSKLVRGPDAETTRAGIWGRVSGRLQWVTVVVLTQRNCRHTRCDALLLLLPVQPAASSQRSPAGHTARPTRARGYLGTT